MTLPKVGDLQGP